MTRMPFRPRHRATRPGALLGALALAGLLAGCGGASVADAPAPTEGAASTSPSGGPLSGEVVVLAAASLTEPFTAVEKQFEAANPGVDVRISFGSSTTLAKQIAEGADADLYAPAGTKALSLLPDKPAADSLPLLATNILEIATPAGNPAKVTGLPSLAGADVNVVLCAATVPCGAAADQILEKAGVKAHVVSREIDVKATLAKVTLGEADAAIVYHSDVVTAGPKVTGVEIPAEQNTTLKYPLVIRSDTEATRAFAALLTGEAGRKALGAAGFLTP